MDEFHYYADRERGVAWQVPLLTLPQARFLLMSATLGDTTFFEEELTRLNGRPTVTVASTDRPVPLEYRLLGTAAGQDARKPGGRGQGAGVCRPLHATGGGAERAGFHQHQRLHARGEGRHRQRARRLQVHQPLRPGDQEVAASTASGCITPGCCRSIACWSSNSRRRACSRSSAARTRSASASTCRSAPCCSRGCASIDGAEDRHPERARFSSDRRARRAQGLRRSRLGGGPGAGARGREPQAGGESRARRQEDR